MMLRLEEHNIGAILPDLPGTNESMQPQHAMDLDKWASALLSFSEQAENPTHVASFRGGSLVDHKIELPHWRLSPVKGRSLLRTMMRTRIAADKESGLSTSMSDLMETAHRDVLNLAGNLLNPEMIKQLDSAQPFEFSDTRTVRLESEAKEADAIVNGGPFWLRAEPSDDMDLVTAISNDLIDWVNG